MGTENEQYTKSCNRDYKQRSSLQLRGTGNGIIGIFVARFICLLKNWLNDRTKIVV